MYKHKYLKYKNKYIRLKEASLKTHRIQKGGFLFKIIKHDKKIDGNDVWYVQRNKDEIKSGGCGIEAVLNCFHHSIIDWSSGLARHALYQFDTQAPVCVKARSTGSMWITDLDKVIEQVKLTMIGTINFGGDLKALMLQSPDVTGFLAEPLARGAPVIAQAMGGMHFVAYRPFSSGVYLEIDAFHNTVRKMTADHVVAKLNLQVQSGDVVGIHAIVKK